MFPKAASVTELLSQPAEQRRTAVVFQRDDPRHRGAQRLQPPDPLRAAVQVETQLLKIGGKGGGFRAEGVHQPGIGYSVAGGKGILFQKRRRIPRSERQAKAMDKRGSAAAVLQQIHP